MEVEFKYLFAVFFVVFLAIRSQLISKIRAIICSSSFYKKFFVQMIKRMTDKYGKKPDSPLYRLKTTQFEQIEKHLQELPGDVLEIGAGSGASLDFLRLPEGCSLVVVDYNPHFEKPFREKLAKYPDIHLKEYFVQSAADMRNIPDFSFSAVIVTDVLCSIPEDLVKEMMQEVRRVLKPNGHFFFLEHVLDKPGTTRRFFQKLICWLNIWQFIGDGCRCDKETWRYIQETGFKRVSLSYTYIPPVKTKSFLSQIFMNFFMFFIQRFLHGYAQK